FLAGDLHLVLHVREDRGLNEISLLANALAAGEHFRAAFATRLDIAHHLVELLLRNLRTLRGLGIEWIADLCLFHLLEHAIDEFIVNLLLHKQPRAGAAALALVEKERKVRAFDGLI